MGVVCGNAVRGTGGGSGVGRNTVARNGKEASKGEHHGDLEQNWTFD